MKLSSLLIEAAEKPAEIHVRDWLVQDLELSPDSSAEILFIQSNKTYLLLEILCGLRLALTGRIDASTGPIATDPARYSWLKIKHAVATMIDDTGESQLYPGSESAALSLNEFARVPVRSGCQSLFKILQREGYRESLSELIDTISGGGITELILETPTSIEVTTKAAGRRVPYHCLSMGQVQTIKAAVGLLLWKKKECPILPILLSHFECMTHDSRIALIREVCRTPAAGQAVFLGTPHDCITLCQHVDFPISVCKID